MASNLACIGMSVADNDALSALIAGVRPRAAVFGRVGGVQLLRWEDESSGARLVLGVDNGRVVDLLPSLTSRAETHLADLHAANSDVAAAAVVDDDGEQVTAVAIELEQRRLLGTRTVAGDAAVVGLGQAVRVHADADSFAHSPDSLLDPSDESDSEPPPHYVERGWTWPPRMASGSFISYGVFGDSAQPHALARLAGVVLTSGHRTTAETGQSFIVARVRTAGFETDLCLSVAEHPDVPEPGHIIAGTVFLVGSMPSLEQPEARKRWWRRPSA